MFAIKVVKIRDRLNSLNSPVTISTIDLAHNRTIVGEQSTDDRILMDRLLQGDRRTDKVSSLTRIISHGSTSQPCA